MSKLIVMVGLPGSGKSTIAKELQKNIIKNAFLKREANCTILSSDAYRQKLLEDENDQSNGEKVFNALYTDMREFLLKEENVIFDATNTSMKARKRIFLELDKIKKELEEKNISLIKIAYVIPTKFEECIERDSKRERTVGREVINKFRMSFQMPQSFEGFDKIVIHNFGYIKHDFTAVNPLLSQMQHFDQKNPHHIYSLDVHCNKLAENYEEGSSEYVAGKLHDYGKLFTRTFDEKGIAHYYSHDSVGTYEVLSHLEWLPKFNLDEVLYILFLINWHMRGHKDIRTVKAEKKYRSLFGNKWYEALIQFADYDIIASGTSDKHEELKEIYG